MDHPLDNLVWHALTGPHAHLARGDDLARRYPPEFTPFHGVAEQTARHFRALAEWVGDGDRVVLCTTDDVDAGPAFAVQSRLGAVQMARAPQDLARPPAEVIPLGAPDASEMLALATLTKPGPFSTRTHELGQFFGIRVGGRLVAMAGERMRLAGYTEVSGVCTLPEFRGQGHGAILVDAVSRGIFQRGETPILHAFSDNVGAIGLYRKLGFEVRREMRITVMRKAG